MLHVSAPKLHSFAAAGNKCPMNLIGSPLLARARAARQLRSLSRKASGKNLSPRIDVTKPLDWKSLWNTGPIAVILQLATRLFLSKQARRGKRENPAAGERNGAEESCGRG